MSIERVSYRGQRAFAPNQQDIANAEQNYRGANTYVLELEYLRVTGEVMDYAIAGRVDAKDWLEQVKRAYSINGGGRI